MLLKAKMQANSPYFQHFQAAKTSLRREQYGDALAHIVFLANVEPSAKDELEEDFIVALRHWAEVLERHGELEKLMVCLQEALRLYPRSEIVLINTGANLLKLGLTDEAASCFRRALHVNPTSLRAKDNLENVANVLVERWHFRMLNDKKRNAAYKQAIAKAISQGLDVVLDIGSGTGILSMFAVQGGAKEVYACEMSKTMYEMGHDVLKANNMDTLVHSVHKKSMDMKVGEDIPKQVSLVVTETLDCGLLGEGIITTVEHAWAHLLLPSDGKTFMCHSNRKPVSKVIPGGAVVYAMAIMCDDIRNQTRSKPVISGINMFPNSSIGGEVMEQTSEMLASGNVCDQLEPYNTECLNSLRGGFRPLSCPFKVTEYDFNDPSSLHEDRNLHFEIPATENGRVDAFAAWFDLRLDEEITLSTGPKDDSLCWEQAIFPVHLNSASENEISKGDLLSVYVQLSRDCLRLQFCGIKKTDNGYESCSKGKLPHKKSFDFATNSYDSELQIESCNNVTIIPPSYMRRLNDAVFNELYNEVICASVKYVKPELHSCANDGAASGGFCESNGNIACNVLDISYGPALFPLFAARGRADHVLLSTPQSEAWIKHILKGNDLPSVIEYGPKKLEEIAKDGTGRKWDIVVSDIVEPSGVIRQQVIEDIIFARGCLLRQERFQIIPMGFTLHCMCIESSFLFANCRILSKDNTLGLDIGQFVNEFQVTTQIDLDLTTLPFTALTDHVKLFSLNFMKDCRDEHKLLSMLETHTEQKVKVVKSGRVQAIPYWFVLHMDNRHSLSTYSGAYAESHWRQAAIVLKEEILVEAGQELLISASCVNSSIFITVNAVKV